MIQFFKKYYRTKIGRSMLITMILLVIPLLAVNLLIVNQSKESIQREITQNYGETLSMTVQQISDSLYDLQQFAIALSVDDDVNELCIAEDDRENLFDYTLLRARLRSYVEQRQIKCSISMYFPRQGWIVSSEDIRSVKGEQNREALLARAKFSQWHIASRILKPEEDCLSLVTGYVHEKQSNPIFFIEINEENVLGMFSSLSRSQGVAQVLLMDGEGNVYATEGNWIDFMSLKQQMERESALSEAEDRSRHFMYLNGEKRFPCIVSALPNSSCVVGIVLNGEIAFRSVRTITLWVFLSMAIFLLMVVLYMMISHRQILRPISELQKAMDKVGRGDFSGVEDCYQDNEIGDIAISLNRMTQQLQKTIEEKYVSEVHLVQARMNFLQAQINPHFLYNCLFSLYTLIKNEDLDNAADLTIYLGKYYQFNTRMDAKDTQLYQELEYIRLLIKIQNLRFSNRLSYEEEIEDELKTMRIPKLTLLTVVENFLSHGMKNLRGPASLRVAARRECGEIVLTVADTGAGIEAEKLEETRRNLNRTWLETDNVHGLQNVLLRCQAMYGQQTCIDIEGNVPHGLIVRIRIPDEEGA